MRQIIPPPSKLIGAILNRMRVFRHRMSPNVKIGKRVVIESGVTIRTQYGGSITIGDRCQFSRGAQLLTHGGDIRLGNDTTVNPYAVIYGQGGTVIGDGVRIAAHCTIVPSNHRFDDPNTFIYKQGLSKKGIRIEDDVWLGSGVKVLDGVTVGRGCVIGAGSIVTRSTEPYTVWVGVPARKIKRRGQHATI